MYEEFDNAAFSPEDYSYIIKKKFDSGTTVEMVFWVTESDPMDPSVFIEVCLRTYTKRRQKAAPKFYYSSRGRDGLRPAIWATNLLLKFPDFLLSEWNFLDKEQVTYAIDWSDSRRRDVYHKWLSRYGFYFDHMDGLKCLTKTFTRQQRIYAL